MNTPAADNDNTARVVSKVFALPPDNVVEKSKPTLPQNKPDPSVLPAIIRDRMTRGKAFTAGDVAKTEALSIEGYSLPPDITTLILYTLTQTAKSNADTKRALDAFAFTMKDLDGKQIYPEVKTTNGSK